MAAGVIKSAMEWQLVGLVVSTWQQRTSVQVCWGVGKYELYFDLTFSSVIWTSSHLLEATPSKTTCCISVAIQQNPAYAFT